MGTVTRGMMVRIWLDVPFEEKDLAMELGARWAPEAKRWFAPRPGDEATGTLGDATGPPGPAAW